MNDPTVTIRFDENGRVYQPGETLAGEYRVEGLTPGQIKAIEVSVLWHSEGKGDEDLAVHDFWRSSAEDDSPIKEVRRPGVDVARPGRFSTTLPASPLSYDGIIVKLLWCVRVRVFLQTGGEVVNELGFQLSCLPAPKAVVP